MRPNFTPLILPTGSLGQPTASAQDAVYRTITLLVAMGAGAVLGQALGGKEWAITGGIVGPVAAIMMMAARPTQGG